MTISIQTLLAAAKRGEAAAVNDALKGSLTERMQAALARERRSLAEGLLKEARTWAIDFTGSASDIAKLKHAGIQAQHLVDGGAKIRVKATDKGDGWGALSIIGDIEKALGRKIETNADITKLSEATFGSNWGPGGTDGSLNPGGKSGKQVRVTCGCGNTYHITAVGLPNAKCPKCKKHDIKNREFVTEEKYHTCSECEANFGDKSLKDGKLPPHKFNDKPCPGAGTLGESVDYSTLEKHGPKGVGSGNEWWLKGTRPGYCDECGKQRFKGIWKLHVNNTGDAANAPIYGRMCYGCMVYGMGIDPKAKGFTGVKLNESVELNENYQEAVNILSANISSYIKSAKRGGTVGMSKGNLRQVVSTKGVNLPNTNAFMRAFDDAVKVAAGAKGFVYEETSRLNEDAKSQPYGDWKVLKTLPSHSDMYRMMRDLRGANGEEEAGWFEQPSHIKTPYSYSRYRAFYLWNGKRVWVAEVGQRRYAVIELPKGVKTWDHDPSMDDANITESYDMPTRTVQRVFDENGSVSETEILCGIRNLKVNGHGNVVSYVNESDDWLEKLFSGGAPEAKASTPTNQAIADAQKYQAKLREMLKTATGPAKGRLEQALKASQDSVEAMRRNPMNEDTFKKMGQPLASLATRVSRINKYLADDVGRKYHPHIPIDDIFSKIRENGFEPLQEDGTSWSGMLLGKSERANIGLRDEATGKVNKWLSISWHKMDVTGKFEVTAYVS